MTNDNELMAAIARVRELRDDIIEQRKRTSLEGYFAKQFDRSVAAMNAVCDAAERSLFDAGSRPRRTGGEVVPSGYPQVVTPEGDRGPASTAEAGEVERVTAYLTGGGLFNPELAHHDAVRDLLIDCRALLRSLQAKVRELEASNNALREDAERWKFMVALWANYTTVYLHQEESGFWSIRGEEGIECADAKWVDSDPDTTIDAARRG